MQQLQRETDESSFYSAVGVALCGPYGVPVTTIVRLSASTEELPVILILLRVYFEVFVLGLAHRRVDRVSRLAHRRIDRIS